MLDASPDEPAVSAGATDLASPCQGVHGARGHDLGASACEGGPDPVRQREQTATITTIITEHHDFVWRTVQRFGVADAVVEDAVQEVFIAAARRIHEFEGRSRLRTWLFAFAMRVAQRHRRTQQRHLRRVEAFARARGDVGGHNPYARSDASRQLHLWLAELDDAKRAVFVLAELEGMTGPEIAEMLDLELPTVYSRLRAARLQLEKLALASEKGGER